MKNKLILIALTIGMMGCCVQNSENEMFDATKLYDPKIVIIDGCEYIQFHIHKADAITHKGNCNNPIHKHNGGQDEN